MIYFVEDDANIRKLVCYALEKEGYEIKDCSLPSEFWQEIKNEIPQLITLVSDIMKISELDEGVAPLEKEQVDLCELSKDIVKRLTSVASKRNIALNVIGDTAYVHAQRKSLTK